MFSCVTLIVSACPIWFTGLGIYYRIAHKKKAPMPMREKWLPNTNDEKIAPGIWKYHARDNHFSNSSGHKREGLNWEPLESQSSYVTHCHLRTPHKDHMYPRL